MTKHTGSIAAPVRRIPRKAVLAGAGVVLTALVVTGIYGFFFGASTPAHEDLCAWQWYMVDQDRVSLLLPAAPIELKQAGGEAAFGTPTGVLPCVRVIRVGSVAAPVQPEQAEQQLTELITMITAQEKALTDVTFWVNEEGVAYVERLTAPESGLVSATRVLLAGDRLYCVYLTTPGEPGEEKLSALFETFFDSISVDG